ncbi:MAG: 3-phytase [Candidatus Azotimanducaceae bacterium]|jgi:3-phytase
MKMTVKRVLLLALSALLTGCASGLTIPQNLDLVEDREGVIYVDARDVPVVFAAVETTAVETTDDAADDPAIWVNPVDPSASLVLGTDKKAGVAVYRLDGTLKQFVPIGLPNNIDLRQGVIIGDWHGDLAIASNRQDDTISIMSIDANGIELIADFPSVLPEPYGACMGIVENAAIVFVTYKTGEVLAHQLNAIGPRFVDETLIGHIAYSSQLEGCVVDDAEGLVYVGEEEKGLWRNSIGLTQGLLFFGPPALVDYVGSQSGIVADVEGVTLYQSDRGNYVVASSQGNDSFAVYRASTGNEFLGRFRIAPHSRVDGAQETDGIAASSAYLGAEFPEGVLIVQDGFNAPSGSTQNFKIIDWRDIKAAVGLSPQD